MFKKIDLSHNSMNIRTASGKRTTDKGVIELAGWVIEHYLKPIENRIKVWTHGKPYTGELGEAEYLVSKLGLSHNECVLTAGVDGLIKRSQRDGAMKLIKYIRENPEYIDYLKVK